MSPVLYVLAFALGLVIMSLIASKAPVSGLALSSAIAALAVISLVAFGTTYRDEFCEEDTGCRVVAGPALVTLTALVPGMVVGLALGHSRKRGDGPG